MGQEIVYCSKCHSQLRSADFEKNRACRVGGIAFCRSCAGDVPPEPPAVKTPSASPEPVHAAPATPSTRRSLVASKPTPVRAVALAVGVLLVLGLVALSVSGGKPAPRDPTPVVERPPLPPSPVEPPRTVPARKSEGARESLRKAQEFARAHPADWAGQLALYDQAAREARDTDFHETVRGERDIVLRRQRDAFAAEAKSIDDRLRPMVEREEFGPAIAAWREARIAHASADWTLLADQRAAGLRAQADLLLAALKGKAIPSRELRERIAKWGLPDLEKALADLPAEPARPVASPEAEAAEKSWRAAMELAAGRDYAAAVAQMERDVPPAFQPEAAADLELLRSLASFHAECLQSLAKWPKDKVLKAEVVDEGGRLKKVEGTLLKADAGGIEIRAGNLILAVPIGELASGTFEELSRARPARKPPEDERMIRFLRLVEGQPGVLEDIRANPDPSLHPKYLGWAGRAEPERERQARRLFYAGEREAPFPATRALSALKARNLLEDFKDTAFVRRNRAALAVRVDLGKDYLLFAEDLEGAGTFRRISAKTGVSWTSESDSDPARQKDNFVEAEFSVLPATSYRAWAYVGGCCAETLGFAAQGTDLPAADPGSDAWLGVKQSVAVTKTHSGHGGRKQPSRWGWVELPVPEFRTPGTKTLRLLTCQQGFSVASIVVSAVRKAPPAEAELRKARAARTDEPVPLHGLGLWLKADEGLILSGGAVSEWKDQSGHQRNAVQPAADRRPASAPGAANGKPAVAFDGKRTSMDLDWPIDGLEGMTIALVSACDEDHPSIWTNAAALMWWQTSDWGVTALCPRQSRVVFMFGTGQPDCTVPWTRPASIGNALSISIAVKDGARESLFVNGALAVSQDAKRPKLVGAEPRATLGGGQANSFFAGRIAELLVYERPLIDVERKRLQQYLRAKYNAN